MTDDEPKRSPKAATRPSRRARAREVDLLVQQVARAMLDGTWGSAFAAEMAAREGVDVSAVEDYAKQAGRLLRIGPDVEAYRAINLRRLDEVYATAGDDPKARVAAIGEQNKMLGLHAPAKHAVEVSVAAVEQLSDVQVLARIRENIAKLQERERQLAAKIEGVIDVPALPESAAGVAGEGDET